MKLFQSSEKKRQLAEATQTFNEVIGRLRTADPEQARQLVAALRSSASLAVLGDKERRTLAEQAVTEYADVVLADDQVTEDEEDALAAVAEAAGLTPEELSEHEVYARLLVAKINAGRLPVVDEPKLITKRGEVVHVETPAALMKEVAVREWHGGSQGFSFPIAKGIRYRVGATRGRLVTVGTELQVADTGLLSITNQRIAYLGTTKTIEMPYSKLIGLNVFADALSFSLSNRQNAPLIKVGGSTDVLAALINAAMPSQA